MIKLISFLLSHHNFTYSGIACNYSLKEYQLDKYRHRLPWVGVVLNKNIIWTQELAIKFLPEILTTIQGDQEVHDGLEYCENLSFPWAVIDDHVNKLNWFVMAHNPVFIGNTQLRKHYWGFLSEHIGEVQRTIDDLNSEPREYQFDWPEEIEWQPTDNPQWQSRVQGSPSNFIFKSCYASMHPGTIVWTKETIAQYEEYIDWQTLSSYTKLPWDEELIITYADRWHRRSLFYNKAVPITLPVLEALQLRDEDIWNASRVWKEVFAQHIDDSKVDYLLDKILQ